MFGWRKKNDGFVWNEYVRTTILLRREQRKQRFEDVREAAVDGVKQAGRQGVAMGVAGASAAGRGLWSGAWLTAATIGDWCRVVGSACWFWLADRSAPAIAAFAHLISRAFDALRQPSVSAPLVLVGAVAALSAAARWSGHGFDRDASIATSLALLALTLAIIPQLAALGIGDRIAAAFGSLPFAPSFRLGRSVTPGSSRSSVASALRVGAVLALAVGAVSWLVPSLMSQSGGTTAATSAAPVLTAASGRIEGKAAAVAGDQIQVGRDLVRLFGIEAPASGQACSGLNKSCAAQAKAALQKLIGGKRVACEISGRQSETVASATCQVNGADLAGQLVRGGHVFATTGLFATYASAEREARIARAGLWRSDPVRPAEHRAKRWDDAKLAAPDGCPIKGTIAGDTKTYLVPWAVSYEKAKVRAERGERWFCTEEQARAAGWKPGEPS